MIVAALLNQAFLRIARGVFSQIPQSDPNESVCDMERQRFPLDTSCTQHPGSQRDFLLTAPAREGELTLEFRGHLALRKGSGIRQKIQTGSLISSLNLSLSEAQGKMTW